MKEIDELEIPGDVRYSATHEWARMSGDIVRVGISDYAQDRLGDITFVEIPQVGASFAQGERCGTLESAKALSELFMPVGGEILAVNATLEESPELINQGPYAGGWIIDVKPTNPAEWEGLMTGDAYRKLIEGLE